MILFGMIVFFTPSFTRAISVPGCQLTPGVPYKVPHQSAVYYISPSCTKRIISNPEIFFSYYQSWSQVREVSALTLDYIPLDSLSFLPWGPRHIFRNGSVIKDPGQPKIYVIINSVRYLIADETQFRNFGFTDESVEDVAPEVLMAFPLRPSFQTSAEYPIGLVFKYADNPSVYILEQGTDNERRARHIMVFSEFERLYRIDRVVVLPRSTVFSGATTPTAPSTPAPITRVDIRAGETDVMKNVSVSSIALPPLNQLVTDPDFNTKFRRVTDRVSAGGFGTQIYSQLQAFSNDNTYLLLNEDGEYVVRDRVSLVKAPLRLNNINAPRWQSARPHTIAFYDSNEDAIIRVQYGNVDTGTIETIFSFPSTYERIRGNQSFDELSHDGLWMGGMAAMQGGDQQIFAVNLATKSLGAQLSLHTLYAGPCAKDREYGEVEPDWVGVSPRGKYLVVQWQRDGSSRCSGLESFDIVTGNFVGHIYDGHQHGDLGLDATGEFFLTFATENTPNGDPYLAIHRLPGPATGVAERQLLTKMRWGQSGAHISCQSTAGFCSVVAENGSGAAPLNGEIFLQYTDGAIRRLIHHRSTSCGYWVQPRASVSYDGRYIAFTSDWGMARCAGSNDNLGRGETYVMELS